MTGNAVCAVEGRYKLLRRAGTDAFYDLRTDPLEDNAISPDAVTGDAAEAVKRLRAAIDEAERWSDESPVSDSATGSPPAEMDPAEARRLEEQMRLLGYM
jgi:hypothetical protein